MKVALLEVSHWHFPLYQEALLAADIDVVAVSDANEATRSRIASAFNANAYQSPQALLAGESALDYVFAFGRHGALKDTGLALVERGIPFAIEKPGGVNAAEVGALVTAAEAKGLPVAVAFVQRVGPLFQALQRLQNEEGAEFRHSSWRFFAGPSGRYRTMDTPWMLDPVESGGGCLINLAPHWLDLTRLLHGPVEGPVLGRASNALHGETVEDYAMVSTSHARGSAMVEAGYCFPDHPRKREYSFSLAGPVHYVQSRADEIEIFRLGTAAPEVLTFDLDSDPLYGVFVDRVLADHAGSRPPVAGLSDLEAVMKSVDTAYASSRPGSNIIGSCLAEGIFS